MSPRRSSGAFVGVFAAHLMFAEPVFQLSAKLRDGPSQWFAEWVATFGLVTTILLTLRAESRAVPMSVGLYITAAYWFTASTSFANPAVTIARGFSDTFAGIRLADVPAFIIAQMLGAVAALYVCRWLLGCIRGHGRHSKIAGRIRADRMQPRSICKCAAKLCHCPGQAIGIELYLPRKKNNQWKRQSRSAQCRSILRPAARFSQSGAGRVSALIGAGLADLARPAASRARNPSREPHPRSDAGFPDQ